MIYDVIQHILQSFPYAVTEIALVIAFLVLMLIDMIQLKDKALWSVVLTVAVAFYGAGEELQQLFDRTSFQEVVYFQHLFHRTPFTLFVRVLILLLGALSAVYLYLSPTGVYWKNRGETYLLLLAIIAGGLISISSYHAMPLLLGIELMSIASYILVAARITAASGEAAIKYLLYGAFTTAITLFALSLLYPTAGIHIFHPDWATQFLESSFPFKWLVLTLFFSGLLFKISLFPFHPWTPDVYQGSDWSIIQIIALLPKMAVFPILLQWAALFGAIDVFVGGLSLLVLATIIVGNTAALHQSNVKRWVAWSGVAQTGFMACTLVMTGDQAQLSLLFYLIVYLFSLPAALMILDYFESKYQAKEVDNFNGLGKKEPIGSVIFVLSMANLIGLPPTAGFYSKVYIMTTLWSSYLEQDEILYLILLLTAVAATLVSLYYYLKIPYALFFKAAEKTTILTSISGSTVLFVILISILPLGIFFQPEWLSNWLRVIVAFI